MGAPAKWNEDMKNLVSTQYSDRNLPMILNSIILLCLSILFFITWDVIMQVLSGLMFASIGLLLFYSKKYLFYVGEICVYRRFRKEPLYVIRVDQIKKISIKTFNVRFDHHLTLLIQLSNNEVKRVIFRPYDVNDALLVIKKIGYVGDIES